MTFGGPDFWILILYLGAVTAWGAWLGRGARGAADYFLGSRNLPWWAVMLSVVATETSTLTFLSIPGVAYMGSLVFLQLAVGYLAGRAVVACVLLPRYYRGELATAYALLGDRFGEATRRSASAVFMATRLLADSVRLFATAIPLAIVTGWSYPVSILVVGALTVVYTYFGGIKAVVWVDALQMTLYVVGGLLALALLGGAVEGGWTAILERAGEAGKLQVLDFRASLGEPYTFWAGLVGGGVLSMASHGTDQLIVQRLLACRSAADGRRALVGSGVAVMLQFALFLLVGVGLWAFFAGRDFGSSDEIFARFIVEEMPTGLRGLLIAGVFAAAMSSLSSSVNSLASASAYDFWGPAAGVRDDASLMRAGRAFTLLWAALLIAGAVVFIPLSRGSAAVEVALAAASIAYGGLLGAFVLGLRRRRPGQLGAILAMGVGVGVVVLLWALARDAIAWPWFSVIGATATVAVGSLFPAARASR